MTELETLTAEVAALRTEVEVLQKAVAGIKGTKKLVIDGEEMTIDENGDTEVIITGKKLRTEALCSAIIRVTAIVALAAFAIAYVCKLC